MINKGYSLSVKDFTEFHNFKKTAAYSSYLRAISGSPVFKSIMNEHIENIDISEDVKKLKNDGRLPDTVSDKALAELFKQSVSRMAICILADGIILKELEDNNIEETLQKLTTESDITYLLGKSDMKYYEQAARMVEEGKIDKTSLAFQGLVSYLKQNKKFKNGFENDLEKIEPSTPIIKQKINKPKKNINFDSSVIEL